MSDKMNSGHVDKTLLDDISNLAERTNFSSYDIIFIVGPEKIEVRASKYILQTASPNFDDLFVKKGEKVQVQDGHGRNFDGLRISLPNYDSEAFQVFTTLTMMDAWSGDTLENFRLPPENLRHLLFICKDFEMSGAVHKVESLTRTFLDVPAPVANALLNPSPTNLENIPPENEMSLEDIHLLEYALRLAAESECSKPSQNPVPETYVSGEAWSPQSTEFSSTDTVSLSSGNPFSPGSPFSQETVPSPREPFSYLATIPAPSSNPPIAPSTSVTESVPLEAFNSPQPQLEELNSNIPALFPPTFFNLIEGANFNLQTPPAQFTSETHHFSSQVSITSQITYNIQAQIDQQTNLYPPPQIEGDQNQPGVNFSSIGQSRVVQTVVQQEEKSYTTLQPANSANPLAALSNSDKSASVVEQAQVTQQAYNAPTPEERCNSNLSPNPSLPSISPGSGSGTSSSSGQLKSISRLKEFLRHRPSPIVPVRSSSIKVVSMPAEACYTPAHSSGSPRASQSRSSASSRSNYYDFTVLPDAPIQCGVFTGCLTLDLTSGLSIGTEWPFICDGFSVQRSLFQTNAEIDLHGVGFFGPIEQHAYYRAVVDVKKWTQNEPSSLHCSQQLIQARQGEIFHFAFTKPIRIGPDMEAGNFNEIFFILKGPDTAAAHTRHSVKVQKFRVGKTNFGFKRFSTQLAEIIFKPVKSENSSSVPNEPASSTTLLSL